MKKPATLTAGVFLIFIGTAQLLRFLFQIPALAGDIEIPVWWSAVAAVFLYGLAAWVLRERNS